MTYGEDRFGFGDALRICLSGGRAARVSWKEGVTVLGSELGTYPAGSYIYQDPEAKAGVLTTEDQETGDREAFFAMSSVCLMVHKPGMGYAGADLKEHDKAWELHSSELFALDWVEVFR